MKYRLVSCIIACFSLLILATGCDKITEPKLVNTVVIPANPYYVSTAEADWKIALSRVDNDNVKDEYSEYSIRADYLADPTIEFDSSDKAALIINNSSVHLTASPVLPGTDTSHFYGVVNLIQGTSYSIGFKYHGKLKMTAVITVPFKHNISFPTAYAPHEATTLTWQMSGNNQYQFAEISSFQPWQDGGDPTVDRTRIKIDPAFRTITFPADTVIPCDNEIGQTGYNISVSQYSCKIVNRIMLLIGNSTGQHYYLFNNENIPSDPEIITNTYADWVIAFNQTTRQKDRGEVSVLVKYLDPDNPPALTDIISLDIGTQHLQLTAMNSIYFFGTINLNPGDDMMCVLHRNDAQQFSNMISIPEAASVSFPGSFNPTEPVELDWTVPLSNEYQFLNIESFKDDGTTCGLSSNYFRQLDGSLRHIYVPPNVVTDFGAGTEYNISLKQFNYQVINRVVVMISRNDDTYYYTNKTAGKKQQADMLERMIRQLNL